MALVGVTGGIGAGKTAALVEFGHLGARTLSADDLVHQLYESPTSISSALRERWGESVIDSSGNIDRHAVARIVFASRGELEWLNQLIHPHVLRKIEERRDCSAVPFFCEIPLLYEADWEDVVDAVVVIWCSRGVQRRRLQWRGWTDDELDIRQRHLIEQDEKLTRSTYTIINNGTREILREQCRRVYAAILNVM